MRRKHLNQKTGEKKMKSYLIRTLAREDLEKRLENKAFTMFSEEQIRAELSRRDVFVNAFRDDPLKYPELSPSFR